VLSEKCPDCASFVGFWHFLLPRHEQEAKNKGCRMTRLVLSGLMAVALPGTAATTDKVALSFGAFVAPGYVSSGIRYSDGPMVHPYVDLGFGGLHAGTCASNVDADLTAADIRCRLSPGYRGAAGGFSHDVGLACFRGAFAGFTVEGYAKVISSGTFAATETLCPTALAAVAPECDQTNVSLRADCCTAIEGVSIGATVGRLDANSGACTYWSAEVANATTENVTPGLSYQGPNVDPALGPFNTDGLIVGVASFAL
jgi:hypothetical protein